MRQSVTARLRYRFHYSVILDARTGIGTLLVALRLLAKGKEVRERLGVRGKVLGLNR